MHIKKEIIEKIITDIVCPITGFMKNHYSIMIDADYKKVLGKMVVSLIVNDYHSMENRLIALITFNERLNITKDQEESIFNTFFQLYEHWLKDCYQYEESIKNFQIQKTKFMEFYEVEKNSFFEINSDFHSSLDSVLNECLSKNINHNISAIQFMNNSDFEQENIDEIRESLDDFFAVCDDENFQFFMEQVISLIEKFHKLLSISIELQDMVNLLTIFKNHIEYLYTESINSEMQELLKNSIILMFQDLEEWVLNVFVYKNIEDIHYFDNSFLSNMITIESLIYEKKDEIEDVLDEDEFF
jgi:hypothetical protein